jgi:enoyl-CoA hydratase/carnithine racemase
VLRYEVSSPRATLTIDDPERRNPMSNAVMTALLDGIERAASDPEVRVIVITGAGDRAFSAGGDLGGGFVDTPVAQHDERGSLARLLRLMRRCGRPLVARVNGHALGGGFGLAAACDVTIAVDTALLGTPEVRVGLWPAMISAVLRDVVPRKAALEMMLTGRRIDAFEAQRLGIVSRVVAPGGLDAAVDEVVDALASYSPAVLRMGRDAWHAMADMDFDAALELLHLELTSAAMTEDAIEGVAAFLQKRPPEWRGR